eukprot:9885414-Lingulodinium_polyedra.AAC.1
MRGASRCGRETSIRPHHCATFRKRCVMTPSNRRFAVATARKPYACARSTRGMKTCPRMERANVRC